MVDYVPDSSGGHVQTQWATPALTDQFEITQDRGYSRNFGIARLFLFF
jgi:hypothetical protein